MLNIFKKHYHFIVEEKDVTTVLGVINKHRKLYDVRVGNCGWKDYPMDWFVMFDSTAKVYGEIVRDLKQIGTFEVDVRPGGQVDIRFKRAL